MVVMANTLCGRAEHPAAAAAAAAAQPGARDLVIAG